MPIEEVGFCRPK